MARVPVALCAGLALMVVAVAVTLTRSPPTVAASNSIRLNTTLAKTNQSAHACQREGVLPSGTTGVRLSLFASYGPRITVKILSGGRVLTSGLRGAGWNGRIPTIPLKPVRHSVSDVDLCFTLGSTGGLVNIDGSETRPGEAAIGGSGQRLNGRMRVEYLRPGNRSWWSLATSVARRIGLGHWAAGTWIVLLEIALMAAVVGGVSWLTVKELR